MPYFKTAYVSEGGAARNARSSGNLLHFNAVRLRVIGAGNLDMIIYSLDDVKSKVLASIAMTSTTNREPRVLTNFIEPRCALYGSTDEINEYIRVNRIYIYSRFFASESPQ
jgi:hypothetical protein